MDIQVRHLGAQPGRPRARRQARQDVWHCRSPAPGRAATCQTRKSHFETDGYASRPCESVAMCTWQLVLAGIMCPHAGRTRRAQDLVISPIVGTIAQLHAWPGRNRLKVGQIPVCRAELGRVVALGPLGFECEENAQAAPRTLGFLRMLAPNSCAVHKGPGHAPLCSTTMSAYDIQRIDASLNCAQLCAHKIIRIPASSNHKPSDWPLRFRNDKCQPFCRWP